MKEFDQKSDTFLLLLHANLNTAERFKNAEIDLFYFTFHHLFQEDIAVAK